MAAYTAFIKNHQKFGDFCRDAWENNLLDLRKLPPMSEEITMEVLKMFSRVGHVIFPPTITSNILNIISNYTRCLTFYVNHETKISRPYFESKYRLEVTIIANKDMKISDPTIDILLSFPFMKTLRLKNVFFTKITTFALKMITVQNLYLDKCMILKEENINFAMALECSKNYLKKLEINSYESYTWLRTIKYIISKIKNFKGLETLNVPLCLDHEKLSQYRALETSQSLKKLHIKNIHYYYKKGDEKNISMLFNFKNIKVTIEEIEYRWIKTT